VSDVRTYFPGIVPSTLRVEFRSDGVIRLRVVVVGNAVESVVDLDRQQFGDLIDTLTHGYDPCGA
jgi:hypothetical protein